MSFLKYPSLENTYREKEITRWLEMYPELASETFVIQEKLHGSNIQILVYPNGDWHIASRNNVLELGEPFFDIWNVPMSDIIEAGQEISDKAQSVVRFYGELYGGNIQKGVNYGREKRIAIFDMSIDDVATRRLIPLQRFFDIAVDYDFTHRLVPIVASITGLQSAIDYNSEIPSELSPTQDIAEGIVIKPRYRVYTDSSGSHFMLKKKNERFIEKMKEPKERTANTVVDELNAEFSLYINANRVESVFSKIGVIQSPNQIGDYIRLVLNDAKEDFEKDFADRLEGLDKADLKGVYNVGSTIANLLKGYL